MTNLEQYRFDPPTAAALAGVPVTTVENWTRREQLFPGERPGSGTPWEFSFSQVFKLAAVRALIEDFECPATRAIQAVRNHTVYGSFLDDRPFVVARERAELHILPDRLWDEMRPRFAERYPGETAAFEVQLATLRQCQATGDYSAMPPLQGLPSPAEVYQRRRRAMTGEPTED